MLPVQELFILQVLQHGDQWEHVTLRSHRRRVLEPLSPLQLVAQTRVVLRQRVPPVVEEVLKPRVEVPWDILQLEEEVVQ